MGGCCGGVSVILMTGQDSPRNGERLTPEVSQQSVNSKLIMTECSITSYIPGKQWVSVDNTFDTAVQKLCIVMPSGRLCLHFPWGRTGGKLKYLWVTITATRGQNKAWLRDQSVTHTKVTIDVREGEMGVILWLGCGQLSGRIWGIHCKQRNVELIVGWQRGWGAGEIRRWRRRCSQKDVLVDTEVRTDFPRWLYLLQWSWEEAYDRHLPPGLIPQRRVIWDIREAGAVWSSPGGKAHEPQICVYHHDRCLSFSLPLTIVSKHDY